MFAHLLRRAGHPSALRAVARIGVATTLGATAIAAGAWSIGAPSTALAAASHEDTAAGAAGPDQPSNYPVNIDVNRMVPDRPPNLELRGVLFVTRHGSRTPISLLPRQTRDEFVQVWGNCPLGDHSTIPCARGLLTQYGEFQLHSVGWHLRQRYVYADQFLPKEFDPAWFHFRSTDLPRTQLSLARAVQGLYPGLHLDTLAPLIEVRKQLTETMYPNHYVCPRLKELYIESAHASRQDDPDAYPAAARYKAIADSPPAQELRAQIARALQTPADQLGTWVVIGDELKCRQSVAIPQVKGITQAMADQANVLAERTFWHILRGGEDERHSSRRPACPHSSDLLYTDKTPLEREVARLGMGRMMEEMFQAMERIIQDEGERKTQKQQEQEHQADTTSSSAPSILSPIPARHSAASLPPPARPSYPRAHFYSGHDTTIAPLLSAFHATHALEHPASEGAGPGWPTLGGNMIVELLEATPPIVHTAEEEAEEEKVTEQKVAAAHRTLEQSLAPFPPTATEDDGHKLPKQQSGEEDDASAKAKQPAAAAAPSKSTSSGPSNSATPSSAAKRDFSPYGTSSGSRLTEPAKEHHPRVETRPPFPISASPVTPGASSRWFIRLLVDHKEVSIIPFDEYKHVREAYRVQDWQAECQQKSNDKLPAHQW